MIRFFQAFAYCALFSGMALIIGSAMYTIIVDSPGLSSSLVNCVFGGLLLILLSFLAFLPAHFGDRS